VKVQMEAGENRECGRPNRCVRCTTIVPRCSCPPSFPQHLPTAARSMATHHCCPLFPLLRLNRRRHTPPAASLRCTPLPKLAATSLRRDGLHGSGHRPPCLPFAAVQSRSPEYTHADDMTTIRLGDNHDKTRRRPRYDEAMTR
jgi:hypothetical protein